ncbi:MAG: heme-binding beta-barrel domain-containing protein [Acidimicrobiales bacterium]
MWRGSEDNPFHTEVGYWLWDGAAGEVVRGFVVPRGITVLAGGLTTADATQFTLEAEAEAGHARYAIGENGYLSERASSRHYG